MSETVHPGTHLDAHLDVDQLNAFAEGALSEHERVQALAHLAECAHCREIAFLAQIPIVPLATDVAVIQEPTPAPWWRRWLTPLPLMGTAALASILLVLVTLHARTARPPTQPIETASSNPPQESPQPSPAVQAAPPSPAPKTAATPPAANPPSVEDRRKEPAPGQRPAQPQLASGQPAAPQPAFPANGQAQDSSAATIQTRSMENLAIQGRQVSPIQRDTDASRAPSPVVMAPSPAPPAPPKQSAGAGAGAGYARAMAAPREYSKKEIRSPDVVIQHGLGSTETASDITGTLSDPAGAIIPRASISLMPSAAIGGPMFKAGSAKPSSSYQTSTDATGQFKFASVPPGNYTLQLSASGFETITRQLNLQPHDLAQLHSVLPVGAATETVMVNADAAMIDTQAASNLTLQSSQILAKTPLPSKLPALSSAFCNGRTLVMDTAGTLFLNHNGKRWKKVHAPWTGKILEIKAASDASAFELTLESGSVWTSRDGEHWGSR